MIYIHSMAKDPDRRDLFSGALDLMILHSLTGEADARLRSRQTHQTSLRRPTAD